MTIIGETATHPDIAVPDSPATQYHRAINILAMDCVVYRPGRTVGRNNRRTD